MNNVNLSPFAFPEVSQVTGPKKAAAEQRCSAPSPSLLPSPRLAPAPLRGTNPGCSASKCSVRSVPAGSGGHLCPCVGHMSRSGSAPSELCPPGPPRSRRGSGAPTAPRCKQQARASLRDLYYPDVYVK